MELIEKKLLALKDEKYQEFQSKLVPNISADLIIGIRTPDLKALAKEIFLSDYKDEFLKEVPHKYYEENLLHMFVVGQIKDFNTCVQGIDAFLPYTDCWPVTDQSSPKAFKKHHQELLEYIEKWIKSNHIYTKRYAIKMLMNEFLDYDFKEVYLEKVASIKGEDYYLKMMIAWYFATALAKQYSATIKYIESGVLDTWTHNKTIQKALESFRVSEEHKTYLRSLKK